MKFVSVVVPLLNEAKSLRPLYQEFKQLEQSTGLHWELIFVDDGSSDSSWAEVAGIAAADPSVQGIRLRQNFGKTTAIRVGFQFSTAPWVAMIDADLQDVPGELPAMLARLEQGCDLVNGWKQQRQDGWSKRFASRVFNGLVNWTSGLHLHDHNCGLKVMRREVCQVLPGQKGMHRFWTVFARRAGFQVDEIPVAHRPRQFGRSRYGWERLPQGLWDLARVGFCGTRLLRQGQVALPSDIVAERIRPA